MHGQRESFSELTVCSLLGNLNKISIRRLFPFLCNVCSQTRLVLVGPFWIKKLSHGDEHWTRRMGCMKNRWNMHKHSTALLRRTRDTIKVKFHIFHSSRSFYIFHTKHKQKIKIKFSFELLLPPRLCWLVGGYLRLHMRPPRWHPDDI